MEQINFVSHNNKILISLTKSIKLLFKEGTKPKELRPQGIETTSVTINNEQFVDVLWWVKSLFSKKVKQEWRARICSFLETGVVSSLQKAQQQQQQQPIMNITNDNNNSSSSNNSEDTIDAATMGLRCRCCSNAMLTRHPGCRPWQYRKIGTASHKSKTKTLTHCLRGFDIICKMRNQETKDVIRAYLFINKDIFNQLFQHRKRILDWKLYSIQRERSCQSRGIQQIRNSRLN